MAAADLPNRRADLDLNVVMLSDEDDDEQEQEPSTYICTACTTEVANEKDLLGHMDKDIGEEIKQGDLVFFFILNVRVQDLDTMLLEANEKAARVLCDNCQIPLGWKLVDVPHPHDLIRQGRYILSFSCVSRTPADSSTSSTSPDM